MILEGQDLPEAAARAVDKTDRGFFDVPVQAGLVAPDLKRLMRG